MFVGGKKGTRIEVRLAERKGIPVVPLGENAAHSASNIPRGYVTHRMELAAPNFGKGTMDLAVLAHRILALVEVDQ